MSAPILSRIRRGAALFALVGLILIPVCLDTEWKAPIVDLQKRTLQKDHRTRYTHRFDGVRAILPMDAVCGFISDTRDLTVMDDQIYSAQYGVTPILIHRGVDCEHIIGDFHKSMDLLSELKAARLDCEVLKDFGNGVVLLRNMEWVWKHGKAATPETAAPVRRECER